MEEWEGKEGDERRSGSIQTGHGQAKGSRKPGRGPLSSAFPFLSCLNTANSPMLQPPAHHYHPVGRWPPGA